jgi:glycosidase
MPQMIKSIKEIEFVPRGKVFASPHDWRDEFIYFLLVDRFDDNNPATPAYDPAGPLKGRDPRQGGIFQGGNLKGVTRRLDYIRNLGCTTIWLSPIFKNRQEKADSYHGYGVQNFLEIDARFGTLEDLQNLIQNAHAKGMHVIQDIILNHTGDNWAYPGDLPYYYSSEAQYPFDFGFWREADPAYGIQENDAVWPIEFQNPEYYKRRGQITNWFDYREAIDGDFLSLKELDIRKEEVMDKLIKVYKYWISVADIDGFRIDTVKHMEDSAAAIFCNAIREYTKRIGKDNFFLFGEIVADDATIERYIGTNTRIEGTNERFPSLDAALDFPLYFVLEEIIKGLPNSNPSVLRDRYERFTTLYEDHGLASSYFVSFVDNHDQMARPYRRFMNQNPFTNQMVMAIGYLLTSHGIPCIYYGSEQGFNGGGDNDGYIRECMFGGKWGAFDTTGCHFFNPNHEIYRKISAIAKIRSAESALRYGRLYFREISEDGNIFYFPGDNNCSLAYSKILDTDEIAIALNITPNTRQDCITVDRHLTPIGSTMVDLLNPERKFNVEDNCGRAFVRVPLGKHQMSILKKHD